MTTKNKYSQIFFSRFIQVGGFHFTLLFVTRDPMQTMKNIRLESLASAGSSKAIGPTGNRSRDENLWRCRAEGAFLAEGSMTTISCLYATLDQRIVILRDRNLFSVQLLALDAELQAAVFIYIYIDSRSTSPPLWIRVPRILPRANMRLPFHVALLTFQNNSPRNLFAEARELRSWFPSDKTLDKLHRGRECIMFLIEQTN